ncbi:MAG: hypothetical protein A2V70_09270 [Planctomycetes bacterium RBG_13_63_9]|nr:MAG: hypothetical protein A2V70_09270 [Planctomycetes bacterium RBG_13_63_9]
MIESIHFTNFKALRDATLPLSPCTVIVGPNGSGKSTVLQALEAFSGTRQYKFEDVISASLRNDENARHVKVSLRWGEQYVEVGPELTEPELLWERGKEESRIRNKPDTAGLPYVKPLIERFRVYSLDANAIAAPIASTTVFELAPDGAGLAGVLTGLRDQEPERFHALEEEMGRWLPEFDAILFEANAKVDGKQGRILQLRTRDRQHKIAAHDVSQGTLLALAMLTLPYLPEPPLLIGLEEPDRGIHPRLLRRVQDAMYRLSHPESCGETRDPVQIIATTHSPYFLDLFKDHPEEIVIANKTGPDVQFERLSDQPHIQEMLGDASLGEIWYSGILGGVPSNS